MTFLTVQNCISELKRKCIYEESIYFYRDSNTIDKDMITRIDDYIKEHRTIYFNFLFRNKFSSTLNNLVTAKEVYEKIKEENPSN